jgi:hypothetical protein
MRDPWRNLAATDFGDKHNHSAAKVTPPQY